MCIRDSPCTDWPGWKDLTIAIVDQLTRIEGEDVVPSQRIKAKQNFEQLMESLQLFIEQVRIKKKEEEGKEVSEGAYTRENRRKMYLEMGKEREEKERRENPKKFEENEPSPMFLANGEIRQCNEGKYDFLLNEWDDPEMTVFEMKIPKYLNTSLIDVNINPKWVSVRVKGKLTQLRLTEEIAVEKSTTQRSQTTGVLLIKMPKVTPNLILKKQNERMQKEKAQVKPNVIQATNDEETKTAPAPKQSFKDQKVDFDDIPDLE
eukprot:TRINITY_DN1877_c0_g3_i8.p1 TRINITY_DN1877_c0_g3~~TRINITY_DN1877_c0_g3_i8.p1  ORF type:complete len:280 (+),score=62.91 TRINITY_DN1877_c0_g3_i8:57-842(+)